MTKARRALSSPAPQLTFGFIVGLMGDPFAEAGLANKSGSYGGAAHVGRERANAFTYDQAGRPARAAYRRIDSQIREDICECMAADPLLDASNVEVQVDDGEVTLTGTVADQSELHRAQDVAEQVYGVKNVRNGLTIR